MPQMFFHTHGHTLANRASKNDVDDYQEPADALKAAPQEEEEKQDPQKTNTTDDYQEPFDALKTDNPQPSLEEEEKQDAQKITITTEPDARQE